MSYTNGNSSKASNKEVKENMNTYKKESTNEIKMGFKVSGGYISIDKNLDKLNIKETETINHAIPMFDIVEMQKSIGNFERKGNVIVTSRGKFEKQDNGNYALTTKKQEKEI